MAGEMSLSKPFLKETKTGQRDLSDLRDLSRVGARAVITPEATLPGPSLAS